MPILTSDTRAPFFFERKRTRGFARSRLAPMLVHSTLATPTNKYILSRYSPRLNRVHLSRTPKRAPFESRNDSSQLILRSYKATISATDSFKFVASHHTSFASRAHTPTTRTFTRASCRKLTVPKSRHSPGFNVICRSLNPSVSDRYTVTFGCSRTTKSCFKFDKVCSHTQR